MSEEKENPCNAITGGVFMAEGNLGIDGKDEITQHIQRLQYPAFFKQIEDLER